jgi:hypothetical protein
MGYDSGHPSEPDMNTLSTPCHPWRPLPRMDPHAGVHRSSYGTAVARGHHLPETAMFHLPLRPFHRLVTNRLPNQGISA